MGGNDVSATDDISDFRLNKSVKRKWENLKIKWLINIVFVDHFNA